MHYSVTKAIKISAITLGTSQLTGELLGSMLVNM